MTDQSSSNSAPTTDNEDPLLPILGEVNTTRRNVMKGIGLTLGLAAFGRAISPLATIPENVSTEVHRIRSSGGRIVTVGVGPQVQPEYLKSLASSPADYHFCSDSVELQGTFINLATESLQ